MKFNAHQGLNPNTLANYGYFDAKPAFNDDRDNLDDFDNGDSD